MLYDAELTVAGGRSDGTGIFTVTCAGATDIAGNAAPAVTIVYEVHYHVAPGVFAGGPVEAPPAVNSGRAGRTYPLRWTLTDAAGQPVTDLDVVSAITNSSADCDAFTGDGNELSATESTGGGLSLAGDEFKFNWASPGQAGCYVLSIELADGNNLTANFELR